MPGPDQLETNQGNIQDALARLVTDLGGLVSECGPLAPCERFCRNVLEAIPVAVYLTDDEGKVIYYNQAAADLAGRRPVVGGDEWCVTWRLFWPDGSPMPHHQCPMAIAIEERRPLRDQEIIAEHPDGSRVPVLAFPTPLFNDRGRLVGAVNVLMDISDRKSAAEASSRLTRLLEEKVAQRTQALDETISKLRESERTFRLLVEGVIDYSMFMLDTEGHVTNWNAGAERIKGYKRSEIVGQHFSRFYTDEARQAGLPDLALATAARTGRFEAEDWRVRKDGSRFWANVVIDAIYDEHGQLVGFAKITRDLTEQRAVEEKLRQLQRMEAIGQLTAGITHDFNNLLTVILGNLELLERLQSQGDHSIGSARAAKCISTAVEGGRRAAALTRRLLAFSRHQALEPEAVDVRRLIQRVRELLERTLGEAIKIQANLAPDLGFVFADVTELENAIINLAVNARDAMPNGGKLSIGVVKVDAVPINGDHDHAEGPHILIDIADTGVGMTQEVASRAFEPFFTTKGPGHGTGLGLSQVYGFVKQSGGHIAVDSQPGLGTSVKIYLPQHIPEAGAAPAASLQNAANTKDMGSDTILVVEDDDAVRAFGTEVLRSLGYSVLEADNASDALKILESRSDVRLLFTDMGLPGLMNGWQLSQEVSRRCPGIKLIVTTAYLRDAPASGPGRGIVVLAKPFSVNDLARKVQEILST